MTLIIKNLSKRYDDNWVIKNVSLEVANGEILGIFGVVGVGKSTLLRAIAGIETRDEGTVFFDSEDLSELPCEDLDFHFPQVTNDSFWKSTFNTITPSELADGEGQALALENALQTAEKVLFLDNQFCFMDRQLRDEYCSKLRAKVKEKNLAVIFATNDFREVFAICDRVAILDNGEILQTGTPREVYENPNTAAVARVTGRNNLIEARRLKQNETETPEFQTVNGEHRLFTNKIAENNADNLNQNYTLVIRPECISISFGASFPEDNLLKARIVEVNYQGATTLIKLDADGLILKALVLRLVGLKIDDECMVGLPPDRILVFKD